ncbi:MAG: hypothetical protein ABI678_00290 [Kofleriaceae bacterium]
MEGQPRGGIMGATCPRCGFHREVEFYMHRGFDQSSVVKSGEIGGVMPSTIITPIELATEMQRALTHVPAEFAHLDDPAQDRIAAERALAYKSAVELLKFIPPGAPGLPDDVFGTELAYKQEHAAVLTREYSRPRWPTLRTTWSVCEPWRLPRRLRKVRPRSPRSVACRFPRSPSRH